MLAYLDYNATAPIRPAAAAALAAALQMGGNPSSVHRTGREARKAVEQARAQVAALVGGEPAQIVFTSGGTEANNQALRQMPAASLIVSAIEHESVLATAHATGKPLFIVQAQADGTVSLDAVQTALQQAPKPALVSIMLANNETGALQPLSQIVEMARAAGAWMHSDAVQGAGKLPLDFTGGGLDLMSVSAHKLGGPQGIGALIVRDPAVLDPYLTGGGQELGRRAGTENVAGIVGFGAAAAEASKLAEIDAIRHLRDDAEQKLRTLAPTATVYGEAVERLPNTLCIGMPGVAAETQVMALDLAEVAVSAGSACSAGKVRQSHVLTAMGVPAEAARSAIRISLGWRSTQSDIDRLVEVWAELYRRTGARAA